MYMLNIKFRLDFSFISLLIIISFFLLIYSPIFSINYINHDDYRFWHDSNGLSALNYSEYSLYLGRYITSGIIYLYDKFVVTISDLAVLRFISMVSVIILSIIFF